jgi:hypothetical protein
VGTRLAVLGTAAALACLPAAAAADPLPPVPQPAVSVRVDDGTMNTAERRVHTYTIRARNIGAVALETVSLTTRLPNGTFLLASDGSPDTLGGQLTWTVDLPVGGEVVRTVKARVDVLPDDGGGLAATACVRLAGMSDQLVCSTDLDELPDDADSASSAGFFSTATLLGTIAAVVAAIAGAGWYTSRRRGSAAEDGGDAEAEKQPADAVWSAEGADDGAGAPGERPVAALSDAKGEETGGSERESR